MALIRLIASEEIAREVHDGSLQPVLASIWERSGWDSPH